MCLKFVFNELKFLIFLENRCDDAGIIIYYLLFIDLLYGMHMILDTKTVARNRLIIYHFKTQEAF